MTDARRVRPPKRYEQLSDRLVENGPFETKQKALMFAAAVGLHIEKREPLDGSGEAIRWSVFQSNGDDAFLHALAIAETGDLKILKSTPDSEEDFITIFEEYANAGLKHIRERILDAPKDNLDQMLQLVLDARKSQTVDSGLEGMTEEDLEVLGGV